MRHHVIAIGSLALLCSVARSQSLAPAQIASVAASSTPSVAKTVSPVLAGNYGKLPLSFEENRGQSDPQVKFVSRGNGYSLFLTDSAAVLALTKGSPAKSMPGPLATTGMRTAAAAKLAKTDLVRMELVGASKSIKVSGAERLPGTANYFIGNDPAKWHSSVPTYAKVRYDGVYPGVDLVYYGNQSQLEYDFVVAPEADTRGIRLHFAGAKKLKLDSNGDLEVIARNGQVAFHKPVVYQEADGMRLSIIGTFTLLGKNVVGFSVGAYDPTKNLIIDPTLAYSTYLGGSGLDGIAGIAVDALGGAYVAGSATSIDFPVTTNAYQRSFPYGECAFVTKVAPNGISLIYSTYCVELQATTVVRVQVSQTQLRLTALAVPI